MNMIKKVAATIGVAVLVSSGVALLGSSPAEAKRTYKSGAYSSLAACKRAASSYTSSWSRITKACYGVKTKNKPGHPTTDLYARWKMIPSSTTNYYFHYTTR